MNIGELQKKLNHFVMAHPKCKDQPVMVKNLDDDTIWEEITGISDNLGTAAPQDGAPLYFLSPSQERHDAMNAARNQIDDAQPERY